MYTRTVHKRTVPLLALLFFVSGSTSAAMGQTTSDLVGTWEGSLALPTGTEIRIVFHIAAGDDALVVTWDSPDQGATGLPGGAPVITGDNVTLPLPVVQGRFEGTRSGADELAGTFHQGPANMPLVLRRTSDQVERPERPQEPQAPLPYRTEDVSYENAAAAGVTLAGTLTVPAGAGPFPAVVLISGSGPQDRDESLMGHRPFLVLADHLTRQGVAVLRFDDRGVGSSTGSFAAATSLDFATDVHAGIDYLKTRPEVAVDKIGLVGHSEGGLIAPIVANETADVAYVVMLAGPGLPGDEIILLQGALIARASGATEAAVQFNSRTQRELFALLKSTNDPTTVRSDVRAALERSANELARLEPSAGEAARSQIDAQVAQSTSSWFHFFITHDPRDALRRLQQPVLSLIGTKDLQVPSRENQVAIRAALSEAGNQDVTVLELDGLNHLFQTAGSGAPSEYSTLTETMSPTVLNHVSTWILERAGS